MIVTVSLRKSVVDEVEGIDGLQQLVVVPHLQLLHIGLRSVEQHPLLVSGRPHHLHLHDEQPSQFVFAHHVDNAVFAQRILGHEFRIHVCDAFDFLVRGLEWQQRIEETDDESGMLAEHFLEREVRFGVQVSHGRTF